MLLFITEAKEKKKQKLSNNNNSNSSITTSNSINIQDMNSLYQDNRPHNNTSAIDSSNFYDANTTDKYKCPYVKAIAVGLGIDTYKATLLKGIQSLSIYIYYHYH